MPTEERDAALNAAIPGMNQKVGAPPRGGVGPKLSDVLDADDADVNRILEQLRQEQTEWDHTTGKPRDPRQRREAQILYLEIKEHADQARARREAEAQQARDRAIAEERNQIEADRVRVAEAEIAGKLELERQRIEIDKAKVVVDAMARIGADPEMRKQFGPMLEAMGQRLLQGTSIGVPDEDATKLRLISTAAKPTEGGGS